MPNVHRFLRVRAAVLLRPLQILLRQWQRAHALPRRCEDGAAERGHHWRQRWLPEARRRMLGDAEMHLHRRRLLETQEREVVEVGLYRAPSIDRDLLA